MTVDDYGTVQITNHRLRELLQHEKDNQALRSINAELLARLKGALELLDDLALTYPAAHRAYDGDARVSQRWRAAIAKAEGR